MIVFDIFKGEIKFVNPETPESSDGLVEMGTRDESDISIDTGTRSESSSVIDFQTRV